MSIKAEDELFVVRDTGSGLEETFETYNSASSFYEEHLEEYDNLLLYEDDRLIRMEYGIVEFNTDEACSLDIDYFSQSKNEDDILNGCYGIDGAYLDTDYRNDRVYFMISDDLGYTSLNNVTLHPYEALESGISVYHNSDHFYHNIKSQLDYDFYSYSLELDDKLNELGEGDYYSYDGHYFYDDFKAMIDDYRNGTRDNSVNEEAYFNYYQFLPHRSLSNYTSSELNEYINETLAINGRLDHYDDSNFDSAADEVNRSQLYGNIEHFFIAQSLYGTNAMMLLSSAIYESSYGRSYPSYANNNLYLSAAYESEAENETRHYDSIADSIYAHSRYFISSRYSNHRRSDYRGTFYGDKASGINVNYSLDSYFGEKSASAYYHLDSLLGNKDRNDKAVGIISDRSSVNFYYDEDLERRRFTLYDITDLSFVILEETENSYKINIDDSNNEDYEYDFSGCIAYVAKDVFSHILNEDRIADYDLNYRYYDLKGGTISDHEQLELLDTCEIKPYREHYEYDGIDEEGNVSYRYIEAIDLIRPFKTTVELGGTIDLRGGLIRVFYEDSTYKDVPIDSDMISSFDMHQEGTQDIRISYNGVAIDTKIEVSQELYELDRDFSMAINDKNYQFVKENINRVDHQFTFEEIRQIDQDLLKDSKRNYYID
ncbi:MAG: bacterial Ig-like domain-containing protein, partial [Erysipelotrichaceae bacterium]|nr:bacterial Ig-like domain-containing protein [Erysipelotrichaceae bacterium]